MRGDESYDIGKDYISDKKEQKKNLLSGPYETMDKTIANRKLISERGGFF